MKNYSIEKWKDVTGYEGYYQVSDFGRVRSLGRLVKMNGINRESYTRTIKERILKQVISGNYLNVKLCKDGHEKTYKVHRLVAQEFAENPNNYPEVNHINENKLDNNLNNLEWCTRKYNQEFGTRKERIYNHPNFVKMADELAKRSSKPVKATNIKSGEVTFFESTMDVQRKLNINNSNVGRVCNGERKQSRGYKFEYI